MRCPHRSRGFSAAFIGLAAFTLAACSSGETAESGTTGTSGTSAPIAIEVSQMYVTVENLSGVPLVEGEIEIVPPGVLPPFRTPLPRLESTARREVPFSSFRSNDGTTFRRGVSRGRTVRVTATDILGNRHEYSVPFR